VSRIYWLIKKRNSQRIGEFKEVSKIRYYINIQKNTEVMKLGNKTRHFSKLLLNSAPLFICECSFWIIHISILTKVNKNQKMWSFFWQKEAPDSRILIIVSWDVTKQINDTISVVFKK